MALQSFSNHNDRVSSSCEKSDPKIATEHKFSQSYEKRKKALITEYGRVRESSKSSQMRSSVKSFGLRFKNKVAAVAVASSLLIVPAGAWAIVNNEAFFSGAFGTSARETVQTHDEVTEYKNDNPVIVTLPSREYVEVDLEKAQEMLGEYTSTEEVSVTVGDHVLTILSTVRDEHAIVVHYTLEREEGVTALVWDDLTNEGKGAYLSPDQPYSWNVVSSSYAGGEGERLNYTGERTLIDPQRSTPNKLYCYGYLVFSEALEKNPSIMLQVVNRSTENVHEAMGEVEQAVAIPTKAALPCRVFSREDGGTLMVSPLSLQFSRGSETDAIDEEAARREYESFGGVASGLSFEDYLEQCGCEYDLDLSNKITITYKDGSEYTVLDKANNLDNTSYSLGREGGPVWMFNRLIDPAEIESISVNSTVFS